MIVALFLQAYMHNYNIVYIMMFFLVSVAVVSTFFGVLNLSYIEVKFLNHSPFFAQRKGDFSVLTQNNSEHAAYDLSFSYKESKNYVQNLEVDEKKALTFEAVFAQRGKFSFDSLEVESLFPLIHEKKSRTFDFKQSVIVFPKPEGISLLEQLKFKKHQSGDLSDFKGVSHYIDGENFSSIHWASLAKDETLMSKRFVYKQKQTKLRFSFSELQGQTEEKLSQLTKWILEATEHNFDFVLELEGKTYDSTKEDIDAILTQLALH